MIRSAAPLAILLALGTGSAVAEEPEPAHSLSANVAITNDYVFRGVTQTQEDPAISGGFDYTYNPFGAYVGVWASNIEFAGGAGGDAATIETDFYGGFRGAFASGVTWDVGGIYYGYPAQNEDAGAVGDYAYWEAKLALGYTFENAPFTPTLTGSLYYSPDYFGEDGDGVYVGGVLSLVLPHDFGLAFAIGHQSVDGDATTGPNGYDYTHFRIGASKTFKNVTMDLSYHDTDDSAECGGALCDGRVVFTVSTVLDLL